MGLAEYKQKRNFKNTTEPAGKKKTGGKALNFVIQKHDATNLHYDFRLELDGVLKSWAVPKGPSLNPKDKRLAMMVEDHPIDYAGFEGVIPEGNYGAGNVIVWDKGTYQWMDEESRKEGEKKIRQGLKNGDVKIVLHGKKVNGAFALVKMKGRGENSWLLIKKKDDFASDKEVVELDKSVISNKTINEIGSGRSKVKKKS